MSSTSREKEGLLIDKDRDVCCVVVTVTGDDGIDTYYGLCSLVSVDDMCHIVHGDSGD